MCKGFVCVVLVLIVLCFVYERISKNTERSYTHIIVEYILPILQCDAERDQKSDMQTNKPFKSV